MEEQNKPIDMLIDRLEAENDFLESMSVNDQGYKDAMYNFRELYKLLMEEQKAWENNELAKQRFEAELAEQEWKKELELRKIDIDERRLIVEESTFEHDCTIKEAEIDVKKKHDINERNVQLIEIGLSVVGTIASFILVKKTLNVNLESFVNDKEAVNAANRLFERIIRR